MSTAAKRIMWIVIIGFGLVLVVIGSVVMILYISPETKILGATSVWQRNTYTKYYGDEIEEIIRFKNIIIEANNTDIQVRVRKSRQLDEGAVTVFEDATGISFNSINRTLVNYKQVIDDNGAVWYKLTISEPEGAVSRSAEVVVNLICEDEYLPGVPFQPYNFVLDTNYSNVTFSADQDVKYLLVDTVDVQKSYGNITFPAAPRANDPDGFLMEIKNLRVESTDASVTCRSPILETVKITSNDSAVSLGTIGEWYVADPEDATPASVSIDGEHSTFSAANITGNVEVSTTYGNFRSSGDINGDVTFSTDEGSFSADSVNNILARTQDASVNINKVFENLEFYADGRGSLTVHEVLGTTIAHTISGSVSLSEVAGGVDVTTIEGTVKVAYAKRFAEIDPGTEPPLNVQTYDGNVTASNVCGPTNIQVEAGGRSNITVSFVRVVAGTNKIESVDSYSPNSGYGNVRVNLVNGGDIPGFDLIVYGTRAARDYRTNSRGDIIKNEEYYRVNDGNTSCVLEVYTSASFQLRKVS